MAEFVPLISEEEGNDTAWYIAGAAGIGSGLFKVPEGVFSLAAELIDLGLDTNLAGKVEQAFDFINPFDELAQQHGAGKLTEALVSIGVPSTIGFEIDLIQYQQLLLCTMLHHCLLLQKLMGQIQPSSLLVSSYCCDIFVR